MNNEALRFRVCRLAMRKSMKFASHWELITNNQQITHQRNIQSLLFFAWVLLLLIESNFIFILFFSGCVQCPNTHFFLTKRLLQAIKSSATTICSPLNQTFHLLVLYVSLGTTPQTKKKRFVICASRLLVFLGNGVGN